MRVYHFLNKQYGLESIEKRRLKVSRLDNLNDPFEFNAFDTANKDVRNGIKLTMEMMAKEKGILCFSKNWTNPVQWSHYADKHQGICLGFDVPEKMLRPINYISEREHIDIDNLNIDTSLSVLFSKFEDWRYEEEVRLWLSLDTPTPSPNGELYFKDYDFDLKLMEVIVGCNANITRDEVNKAMGDNFHHVEPFKARSAFKSFKMVHNNNEELWD